MSWSRVCVDVRTKTGKRGSLFYQRNFNEMRVRKLTIVCETDAEKWSHSKLPIDKGKFHFNGIVRIIVRALKWKQSDREYWSYTVDAGQVNAVLNTSTEVNNLIQMIRWGLRQTFLVDYVGR